MSDTQPTVAEVLAALETLQRVTPTQPSNSGCQIVLVGTQDEDGDLNLYSLTEMEWLEGLGSFRDNGDLPTLARWLIERFKMEPA